MGSWGQSCLSLAVETVYWSLVLSEYESGLVDGEEHGLSVELSDELLVVGDEGSGSMWVLSSSVGCKVPFRERKFASNLSKHNSASCGSLEMGLEWVLRWFWKGWSGVGPMVVRHSAWFVWRALREGVWFRYLNSSGWLLALLVVVVVLKCKMVLMIELLSCSGVVHVDCLVKGDGVSVLIGQMCCLLCLYQWPWTSMQYDLWVWAWPNMVPS